MRSRRRAFTIVELLVVICIIMILVGLLLPAVAAAYRTAMEYECQNNLHQLAVVVATYCQDNDGYFPVATSNPTASNWLYSTAYSAEGLKKGLLVSTKRVGSTNLFLCPIDVDNGLSWKSGQIRSFTNPDKRPTSYVINQSITYGNDLNAFNDNTVHVRRISDFDPNDFLFVEESSGILPDTVPSLFDAAYITPVTSKYNLTKRHHGGGYIAYMDGSVQWWSQPDYEAEAKRVNTGTWYKNATDPPNHWNPG